MTTSIPAGIDLCVSTVQVIKGGEPDDHEAWLQGRCSPLSGSGYTARCACRAIALPYGVWEALDKYDLYSNTTDLWVRVLEEDTVNEPLPEGSVLLETHTVVYGSN